MVVYLIRHGESVFNAEGRIQGQTDIPLSDFGRQQAAVLAKALNPLSIDAIYASPLRRAMETAQPIAELLRLPIRTDERLKEIHAGIFQGLLWSEIDARHGAEASKWREYDPDFVIPGGESRRQLMHRGRAALDAVCAAGHKQPIIVAHGGVLGAAIKSLLDIPAQRHPFSLYNASISKLVFGQQVRLLTLNQIDHLRTAGLALEDRTGDL
jgi:broad specificity phosphatase PhoE